MYLTMNSAEATETVDFIGDDQALCNYLKKILMDRAQGLLSDTALGIKIDSALQAGQELLDETARAAELEKRSDRYA